ncbi:hypothetical protein HO173_010413 [Letharia columbiana]|uniref:SRR1-like domain-containing protein n=1 Tax=Letharia columbiana TaxID=112416 RepID=A0A8H6L0Y7_9LECA|nr:uncharacterized protein HO173_010413 [Letharia columbiana]KAF6231452.1 hypothetical protein HO173_010413 [Letharia columbiana]
MENKGSGGVANTPALPTPRPPAPSPKAPRPAAPRHKPFTPKEAKAGIETCTQKFRNSTRSESLTALFEQGQKTSITQCICLDLGPFMSFENKSARETSTPLSTNQPCWNCSSTVRRKTREIKVYSQDPVFTRSERDHLQPRVHTVLHNDDAFAKMSKTTFLSAPYLDAKNISRALTDTSPSTLYIGTDLDAAIADIGKDNAKEFPGGKEKCFRPLREFGRDSAETLRLPIFAHGVRDGHDVWAEASVSLESARWWREKGCPRKFQEVRDRLHVGSSPNPPEAAETFCNLNGAAHAVIQSIEKKEGTWYSTTGCDNNGPRSQASLTVLQLTPASMMRAGAQV